MSRTIGNFFTDRRRLKYLRYDERYSSGVSAFPRIEANKRHCGELVAPEPRTVLRSIIHPGTNPILMARAKLARFETGIFPLLPSNGSIRFRLQKRAAFCRRLDRTIFDLRNAKHRRSTRNKRERGEGWRKLGEGEEKRKEKKALHGLHAITPPGSHCSPGCIHQINCFHRAECRVSLSIRAFVTLFWFQDDDMCYRDIVYIYIYILKKKEKGTREG